MADNPPMTALSTTPPSPAPPPSAAPSAAAAPLTPAHYQQLATAQQRFAKIRRAIRVATTDAVIAAVIAGSALLMSVASLSVVHILVSLAICGVAFVSFHGVILLRKADPLAARLLGFNQLALLGIIAIYCAYSLYSYAASSELAAAMKQYPELAEAFPDLGRLAWTIALITYIGVFVGSLFCQGFAALYYFTRARHLRAYRQETPPWILQLQQFQSLR